MFFSMLLFQLPNLDQIFLLALFEILEAEPDFQFNPTQACPSLCNVSVTASMQIAIPGVSYTYQFDANPIVYKGIWDGTFKYDWTQNPAWIIYDLLTNTSD